MDIQIVNLDKLLLLQILAVRDIVGHYDYDDAYALDDWLDDSSQNDNPPDTSLELDHDFAWTVISAVYLTLSDTGVKGGPTDFFFQSCQIFDAADEIRMSFSTDELCI